jgi:ABC-2 type transport system permease protein
MTRNSRWRDIRHKYLRDGRATRIFLLESTYEVLKLWRLPSFVIPTILFPVIFYVLFGLVLSSTFHTTESLAKLMVADFGALGVMATSMFGFGVRVSVERGQGWLELKRVSPAPIFIYFASKLVASVTFSATVILIILVLGNTFGGAHLGGEQVSLLGAVLLLGCIPFSALGLAIGCFAEASAAPAVVNAILWPLAFLSGMWIPLEMLPRSLQRFAPFLPAFHFSRLAGRSVGATESEPAWFHLLILGVFTLCFLAIAAIGFRRDER